MDASLVSSINRRDARLIAEFLDIYYSPDWAELKFADTLMSEDPASSSDRAWIIGMVAPKVTTGLYFDGNPADCDWEDLYSHLRAEIAARRAPQPPSVCAPDMTARAGVV